MAKCLNGGACVNGKCICRKNFEGEICEVELNGSSNLGWIILLILLIAALIVGGVLVYKHLKNEGSWKSEESTGKYNSKFLENNAKAEEIK